MCPACLAGLHEECYEAELSELDVSSIYCTITCCCANDTSGTVVAKEIILGGYKDNDTVRDATSTGRKRAVKLKPIIEGMVCEWANLKYAGGGANPIVGCTGVILTTEKGSGDRTGNIHHGPDKSTLNNSDENLHRICGRCHNRWHTANDWLYPPERPANGAPFLPTARECRPHDKHTLVDEATRLRDDRYWLISKSERQEYKEYVYNE